MLKLFRVSNFKSLINVEVRPTGLNLLVGPNNAGKTNLCHALRFLALTSRMSLDDAARHCTAEHGSTRMCTAGATRWKWRRRAISQPMVNNWITFTR